MWRKIAGATVSAVAVVGIWQAIDPAANTTPSQVQEHRQSQWENAETRRLQQEHDHVMRDIEATTGMPRATAEAGANDGADDAAKSIIDSVLGR